MKKVFAYGGLNDKEVFPPNIHINIIYEYEFYIGKNSTNLPNLWVSLKKPFLLSQFFLIIKRLFLRFSRALINGDQF